MFKAELYRNDEMQDVVEVMVAHRNDDHFIRANRVKVSIHDYSAFIRLEAVDMFNRSFTHTKPLTQSMQDAIASLIRGIKQKEKVVN